MPYDAQAVKRKTLNATPDAQVPKLTSLPKAARKLGIGLRTLKRLIADGSIKTFRVYSRELISIDELDRFLAHGPTRDLQPEDSK